MIRILAFVLLLFGLVRADAQVIIVIPTPCGIAGGPNFPFVPCPTIDMDFVDGLYFGAGVSNLAVGNSGGTNLIPSSPSGFAYTTFGTNVARITPGLGLLVEEARTNFLLNSTAPATQTTGTLATGTYTLWVNGSGTATMSAGTATGCGTSAASQGVQVSVVITVTGTCTVTVGGSLNAFQLELNPGTVSAGTSLIITGGATATRNIDIVRFVSVPSFGSSYSIYGSGTFFTPATYTNNRFLLDVSDNTANNRLVLFYGNTGIGLRYTVSSVNVYSATFASANLGKVAMAATNGAQAGVAQGTLASTGTGAGTITPTDIAIGTTSIGEGRIDQLNGYVYRIAIWTTTLLTAAQLASITIGNGP